MYNNQVLLNKEKQLKLVNLPVDNPIYYRSYLPKDIVCVYNGLKNYYSLVNNNYAYNFDNKVDMYYLDRYQVKPIFNSLFYTSFFFPKRTIKSRYIYEFFLKNNSLRLSSFEKLTRRLNKAIIVGTINKIINNKQRSKRLLNNFIFLRRGNYNSGYVVSTFGISNLFFRYRRMCFKSFIFIPKRIFFARKYGVFEHQFFKLVRVFLNRTNYILKYVSTLKYFSVLSFKQIFKKLIREFVIMKLFFRLYIISRRKAFYGFKSNYKFKSMKKFLKIFYPIYKFFILKNFRRMFISFFKNINLTFSIVDNSVITSLNNINYINHYNLSLDKIISLGTLTNFITGMVTRRFVKKNKKRVMLKLFDFYSILLESKHMKIFNSLKTTNFISNIKLIGSYLNSNSFLLNYVNFLTNNFYFKKLFSIYNTRRLASEMMHINHAFDKRHRLLITKPLKCEYYTGYGIIYRVFNPKYKMLKLKLKNKLKKKKQNYLLYFVRFYNRNYKTKFLKNKYLLQRISIKRNIMLKKKK